MVHLRASQINGCSVCVDMHARDLKKAGGSWTATPRPAAYICELIRFRDGRSELNHAIYHDRYQRTPGGWKFTERVYEVRYLDTSPPADSAPHAAGRAR